mgnify:CR=1 FL=1
MKKFFIFLILILGGCAHTINYVRIYRGSGVQWQIDNPFLAKDLKIEEVKEIQKGELLYIAVRLRNTWFRPISGKIKAEFYDENGIQLENPWGWHPILLEANQDEWIEFMAPRVASKISSVKIMIRGIGTVKMPVIK